MNKQKIIEEIFNTHRTGKAWVMGILNITPDSFSDGGDFLDPSAAVTQAQQMLADGAAIIDIGAESTRPGSERVSAEEQISRLREIIPAVAETDAIISIDTTSSAVAEFALDNGADIINDVSAGTDDPAILKLAAHRDVPIILMHMLGQPCDMQKNPQYYNVVEDVKNYLAARVAAAIDAGASRNKIMIDPGIGFGKKLEHNIALLKGTAELTKLGCPILIGASRKRFIGDLTGEADPAKRVGGTIAACLETFRLGATVFRVHDVKPVCDALKTTAMLI